MSKKQVLRSGIFVGVLIVVLLIMCDLFELGSSRFSESFHTFETLEEDTIDAVLIGTSGIDRYWIPGKGYDEYGMTVFPLSTDGQPSWLMLNMLKEAEEKNPELVVFDMRPFTVSYGDDKISLMEARSRRVEYTLDFYSSNRIDAIKRTLDVLEELYPEEEVDELSHYVPFIKFHSKWSDDDFTFTELSEKYSEYHGFYMGQPMSIKSIDDMKKSKVTDERAELEPLNEKMLIELLDYCDGKDYEVLFIDTPHYIKEKEMKVMNSICDILDERGYSYLLVPDSDYDLTNDFYNDSHMNYYGAEKFTEYFAAYLDDKYAFEDHRTDESVNQVWAGHYDRIKAQIAAWEAE